MSEGVYKIVQFGRQASMATAVNATTLFPADTGFLGFELDRAPASPDEDYGSSSREQPSRESFGVRAATASMPFVARFEDFMHPLEMHVASIGSATGGAYTYTYDDSSDTLKNYTIEYGVRNSTQDEWRAYGVIATEMTLGFDALSVPGNSMWNGTLTLLGVDREIHTLTAGTAAPPPTTLETMEGHLTTIADGTAGTSFASLGTVAGTLKQFSLTSNLNAINRAYGGTADLAYGHGRSAKGEVTFDALVAINSTTKTNFLDTYNVAGGLATERRMRITVNGTGSNKLTIDFRYRLRKVDIGNHEDERLYAISGVWVKDATLGGRGQFTLTNSVSTIP